MKIEIDKDGTKRHYNNQNQLHCENGPAIEYADGIKYWFINDQLHREDGPAIERPNGDKDWYFNGKRHREDGPACEYANGAKYWYINGKYMTEEEFNNHNRPHVGKTIVFEGFTYTLS